MVVGIGVVGRAFRACVEEQAEGIVLVGLCYNHQIGGIVWVYVGQKHHAGVAEVVADGVVVQEIPFEGHGAALGVVNGVQHAAFVLDPLAVVNGFPFGGFAEFVARRVVEPLDVALAALLVLSHATTPRTTPSLRRSVVARNQKLTAKYIEFETQKPTKVPKDTKA